MSAAPYSHEPTEVKSRLYAAGFDLLHDFSWARVGSLLDNEFSLPRFSSRQPWGVFVGNSRALWNTFIQRGCLTSDDPLDSYVESAIGSALQSSRHPFWLGYAHTKTPAPLPMQRLAHACGFAHLGPAQLCVRGDVGPWCALRAVIVFDHDAPPHCAPPHCAPPHCAPSHCAPPHRAPSHCAPSNCAPSHSAPSSWAPHQNGSLRRFTPPPAPCEGCSAPCVAALRRALSRPTSSPDPHPDDHPEVSASSAPWLAVREACPVAQEMRYGKHQLRYHYDKDRRALCPDT